MSTWSSVNRTVPYEWLSPYYWVDLEEGQLFATQWMYDYNHGCPNIARGAIKPLQRLWPWPHNSTSERTQIQGITAPARHQEAVAH